MGNLPKKGKNQNNQSPASAKLFFMFELLLLSQTIYRILNFCYWSFTIWKKAAGACFSNSKATGHTKNGNNMQNVVNGVK